MPVLRLPRPTQLLAAAALSLATLAAAPAGAQTLGGLSNVYAGNGFTIPDNTTRASSIAVSGFDAAQVITQNALGQSVVVRLNTLTHTWIGDVWARLLFTPLSGEARTWTLFFRPGVGVGGSTTGSSRDLNGSYSFGEYVEGTTFEADFVDAARFGPPIIAGGDYFGTSTGGGEYSSPFEAFGGLNPNGTWTLEMRDNATADTGNLASWDLAFAAADPTSVVPEPSTYALLGTGLLMVGGVAARRRRRA